MSYGIEVIGNKEAQVIFLGLRNGMKNSAVRPAVKFALTPVVQEARRRAPKDTGLLKKSIGKLVKTDRRGILGLVGPRVGDKYRIPVGKTRDGKTRYKNPSKYAHFVELGTKRGVKATNFLRDSMLNNKALVIKRLGSKIAENIPKIVRRHQVKQIKKSFIGKTVQRISPSFFK